MSMTEYEQTLRAAAAAWCDVPPGQFAEIQVCGPGVGAAITAALDELARLRAALAEIHTLAGRQGDLIKNGRGYSAQQVRQQILRQCEQHRKEASDV